MRRLLVTGGAGFIGSNFVHYWVREHADDFVVVLDALTYAGNIENLTPVLDRASVRFVQGNICDIALVQKLLREEQLDTIVHFAAESHVDRSIMGPDPFVETNVNGTHCLLKAARQVWLEERRGAPHRFHHVSTDEVYGSLGPNDPPFTETTAYAPNSPYAASKAASDHLVRAYHHTYGLEVTTSNCSNNYGAYHFPEKLIPLVILNVLAGKPLPLYGDGRNIRDWLHVSDHCRAVDLILSDGRPGEVYNVGGRSELENLEIVRMLCSIADELFAKDSELRRRFASSPCARGERAETLIQFVADRPGHDRRYAVDCTKAERELGFVRAMTAEDGLRQTFRWFVENEHWWRNVTGAGYERSSQGRYPSTSDRMYGAAS